MPIKKILTRRDFLGSSAVHSFGSIFLPSLATLLRNERALATGEACSIEGQQMPAFIAIDLQGGASIAGNNVMVYDKGGELLTNYSGLGLASSVAEGDIDSTTFGLPMHKSSPMLRGMKATTTAEVRAKVNGFVICAQSADDTRNNQMATAPGIFKAGCNGSIVPLVGMRSASAGGSGGNSMTPFGADVAPTLIENLSAAEQLISAGNLWEEAPRAQRLEKVLKAIENLSSTRLKALGKLNLPQQAAAMVGCSYAEANEMMSGSNKPNLNPDADDALNQAPEAPPANYCGWNWHGSHGKDDKEKAIRQIGYMVLKGFAGSGTITLSGYDYHDSSVQTGLNADIQAGRVIGEMLSMAHALQRKLMLHIYTDGGVDSAQGDPDNGEADKKLASCGTHPHQQTADPAATQDAAPPAVNRKAWTGDSEARAAAFVLVYDPAGRPDLSAKQMGAYKSADSGTVDLQPSKHAAISNNAVAHASAVVANYLAWQGREAELFTKVMNNSPIRETELSEYLFLQKP